MKRFLFFLMSASVVFVILIVFIGDGKVNPKNSGFYLAFTISVLQAAFLSYFLKFKKQEKENA